MAPPSPFSFRLFAAIFAGVLGLQAAWIIAAEFSRPALPFFPSDVAEAKTAATHQSTAAVAAYIGWPRGDLWVDNATSANATLLGNFEDGQAAATSASKPARIAETAAGLAPADARPWLLLAMLSAQAPSGNTKAQAQLKMSYYTSPYNEDLFPLRVQIAARLPAITDEELRGFATYEIGMIVGEKNTDLKSAIVSAFRNGSAAGRQLLEAAVGTKDPKLISQLHAISP